ncbi:hypothetical protein F4V57_08130 [Acinetobacter qingfengensis]|uniref:Capsular biosynthesis protein n=1 Tax=Acinetobacter qingfengensis TaxID=1262585 RepID=A0A1E7R3C4_9GAMM|nr:capsular polysaccharide synthesis protein [Acinetobacter qingfengensis]KAA8733188.1 hypothetical protein F4V57_08130 [Acinetobacter qingfengensis]OEY93840.1 hypothetical protein BJI46_13920 [Acinetobacter qingfengensis]
MKIFKKVFFALQYQLKFRLNQRQKNLDIDNQAGLLVLNPVQTEIIVPKIIWMYWEGKQSRLVQNCIANIKYLHPTYDVNIINSHNLNQFCDLDLSELTHILPQHRADLIRLKLLYQHGGIWLDASIILYESLDWIITLMKQEATQTFAYYRKKNTNNLKFPVVENWLMASASGNLFFKHWFDEFLIAIQQQPKNYINEIKKNNRNSADIFQNIGNLEYLIAYIACQKMMRCYDASLCLINCDQNAFYYQVKNKWTKEKILIDLAINYKPSMPAKLIKLARKERKYLEKYYDKQGYFSQSLLDFYPKQLMD